MILVAIIISSVALLAAAASIMFIIQEKKRNQKRNTALLNHTEVLFNQLSRKIEQLESGTVPDFEKAKAAAQAVNEFNAGITGILGFDPHEALRKQRSENLGGEHV